MEIAQLEIDEPFRRQRTKPITFENIKDYIFQKNRASLSNSPVRLTKISISTNPTQALNDKTQKPVSLFDKIIQSDHKINKKKIQIIKLPKLPYGRHQNYNSEDLFVTNHFIPTENSEKTRELDEAIKKFRLFEKKYNKSQKNSIEYIDRKLTEKKTMTYKTKAGLLICKKNQAVLDTYEEYSSVYRNSIKVHDEDLHDSNYFTKSKTQRNSKVSINNTVKRLYPTPEPSKNKFLSNLYSKYMVLFSDEK